MTGRNVDTKKLSSIFFEMAKIEALGGEKLMGQDKWLGGVGSPCGKYIYGVPGHAKDVLRITVDTGEVVRTRTRQHARAICRSGGEYARLA